jgi:hypothetical protein
MAVVRELCTSERVPLMVSSVPEYGPTVNELIARLRPHSHEVNR